MAASNSRIDNKTNGSVYVRSILTKDIMLSYQHIGSNLKKTLEKKLSYDIEGKCDVDGFIKPNSCKIMTFSSGMIKGNNIKITVVFECLVCSPVEGMTIPCVIKNITKAGVKAEYEDNPSPVTVFLTRDHHYNNKNFAKLVEGARINVKVIGQRFELNDTYISVIGTLSEAETLKRTKVARNTTVKQKIVLED